MRRSWGPMAGRVGSMVVAVAMLAGAATAKADTVVNPGSNFNATVTGGEIKIGSNLEPIDVGTMTPSPRLRNVTVNADGTFSAAATDFVFPQLTLQVDSPVGTVDIFVQIRAASPVTGTIDPGSGEVRLNTSLSIQLTSNHAIVNLGSNCYVGPPSSPIPFQSAGGATAGLPYDEYSGQTRIDETVLAIPAASGCPTIVGQNVNQIVNDELGLPSASGNNSVKLEMRFNPMPHSADWVDPEGPGNIAPVIVNDTPVEVDNSGSTVQQRSWLESFSISDGANAARGGNTVRLSLLVKHNPGRTVTGLKIDDNWDENDDSDGATVKPVTAQQPVVSGGFNYSRVTFEYPAPSAGMNLTCPDIFGGDGVLGRTSDISVRAVMDNGSESDSSTSKIKLSREDCSGKLDPPMVYGWEAQSPAGPIQPNTSVAFKFRGDDTDEGLTTQNKFGGYTWRLRNLDTGETTSPTFVCPGSNQDNALQTLNVNFTERGRWIVEARLHNLNGDIAGNGDCGFNQLNGHYWYWLGAVDVNSAAEVSGTLSPSVNLSVPARPSSDGTIVASISSDDPFDVAAGGLTQSIEWDLDGDTGNGYETVRLGDSRTGLVSGQKQILIDTTEFAPGTRTIRARVGDNGALGGADDIRRTNTTEASFLVNTPPVAEDLSVQTPAGEAVDTPLTASDANSDALTWSVKTPPANGFLAGEWPNRSYHPNPGFSGTDSFEYQVNDGYGGVTSATVTITVAPPPDGPEPPGDDPGPEKDSLSAVFDEARLNLNEAGGPGTSGVKVVDSAASDPAIEFNTKHWDRSTGKIFAPATDLAFPAKNVQLDITDPLPLSLDVKIEFSAVGPISGSYDSASGAMALDFNARALITVSAADLGEVLKCDVTPIPFQFSSSGADLVDPGDGAGRPAKNWQAKAFDANGGAVTDLWDTLPASTAINEPLAPVATCAGTLDALVGGKGGFWLGGKVTVEGGPPTVTPPKPTGTTAVFDGKRLHVRLKCPARFKPSCRSVATPVTGKKSNKAMSKSVSRTTKSGKWRQVSFLIKPKFRATVLKMSKRNSKQLYLKQRIRSKKLRPQNVVHRYKVRSAVE